MEVTTKATQLEMLVSDHKILTLAEACGFLILLSINNRQFGNLSFVEVIKISPTKEIDLERTLEIFQMLAKKEDEIVEKWKKENENIYVKKGIYFQRVMFEEYRVFATVIRIPRPPNPVCTKMDFINTQEASEEPPQKKKKVDKK